MTTTTDTRPAAPPATSLEGAWAQELAAAADARRAGATAEEWLHLERAHILSQPRAGLHLRTHGAMLGAATRNRDVREIAGQLVRLVLAAPGSLSGRYPVGNTGGADVSAFRPMDIPSDLQPFLTKGV